MHDTSDGDNMMATPMMEMAALDGNNKRNF